MNQIRICAVVTGATIEEFLKNIKTAEAQADIIELRVDYIKNINLSHIDEIKRHKTKPAIFTFRKKDEGGANEISENEQFAFIRHAIDREFEYIDVEYSTLKKFPIDKKNSLLITSWHNFLSTPKYWELTKLVFEMKQTGADIIKIATMILKPYDIQILYRVLLSKKPEENQIMVGMGDRGRETRLFGPLLGSYLTYASVNSTTAPGQINITEMQKFYEYFKNV